MEENEKNKDGKKYAPPPRITVKDQKAIILAWDRIKQEDKKNKDNK